MQAGRDSDSEDDTPHDPDTELTDSQWVHTHRHTSINAGREEGMAGQAGIFRLQLAAGSPFGQTAPTPKTQELQGAEEQAGGLSWLGETHMRAQ